MHKIDKQKEYIAEYREQKLQKVQRKVNPA